MRVLDLRSLFGGTFDLSYQEHLSKPISISPKSLGNGLVAKFTARSSLGISKSPPDVLVSDFSGGMEGRNSCVD